MVAQEEVTKLLNLVEQSNISKLCSWTQTALRLTLFNGRRRCRMVWIWSSRRMSQKLCSWTGKVLGLTGINGRRRCRMFCSWSKVSHLHWFFHVTYSIPRPPVQPKNHLQIFMPCVWRTLHHYSVTKCLKNPPDDHETMKNLRPDVSSNPPANSLQTVPCCLMIIYLQPPTRPIPAATRMIGLV